MVALKPMGGSVPSLAEVVEEASHFTLDLAFQLKASDQGQLRFLDAGERPETRGHLLGQQLTQLPKLDQRRVGILREIALRQDPQPKQLFVVAAQVGEVGAHHGSTPHRATT